MGCKTLVLKMSKNNKEEESLRKLENITHSVYSKDLQQGTMLKASQQEQVILSIYLVVYFYVG